ncbi:MAG: N-6 DNA methylase, partial [Deltaproteobacteria bacterium]|nr:N-6 DNA methylase [Deltaproteobacteria bacterium]
MAIDYTGIDNHNEYYTNHYFYNLFQSDVKAKIKELTPKPCADGVLAKAPWTKLRGYARLFFEALDRAKKNEDPNDNLKLVEDLAIKYLDALGYPKRNPISVEIDKDMFAPVFLHSGEKSGDNLVWIILSTYDIFPKSIGKDNGQDKEQNNGENSDHYRKLSKEEDILNKCAFNLETSKEKTLEDDQGSFASITDFSNHELISKALFKLKLKNPPRFIMLIGLNQIILVDRNRWNSKRYLSFNLEDIFLLKDTNTLEAMTALLYRDSLSPQDGESALDEFHDKSYRNALEVSEGLKYSLRECVELLGNEIIHYWNSVSAKDQDKITIDSKELSIECLRYMYRILFVLFIEADPKLRYAPMKEQSYASAYSFESLRDIADNVNAETVDLSKSYFIFESLTLLFNLIYNGYPFNEEDLQRLEEKKESLYGVFKIEALKAHIFDPERTPLITGAKLRDSVMIRIVRLMSISRPKEKKGSRPGRISYSTLGVNQLGAVYENLLSFSGFIAKETLFEVKVKDAPYNELDVGYFVTTKDLNEYSESERVYVTDKTNGKQLKKYEKGQFIFRIAGREKENSASYYTPESLTKCLVKYALKELLDDKTAEDILKIKVIEPAMGSAAFLNETINQLAESYIVKKREELGEKEDFNFSYDDLQSVKMFIADRNVYGIDLNPVAVELAEVSLWLNTIHTGGIVPWFGTQLVCGNSLLGARRECYDISQLKAGNWYDNVPKRIAPGEKRKEKHEIYHFLLGDPAMSLYKNKVVKELEKDKIKFMHDWQKEFTKPLMDDEIQTALFLSVVIDELWENQAQLRKKLEKDTLDPLSFFGHVEDHSGPRLSIRKKDEILTKIYKSEEEKNAGSYARLKFAMDYWCALWFWPIEKAELLPSRSTFLLEMSYILKGTMESVDKTSYILGPDGSMRRTLFPSVKEELVQVYTDLLNGLGVVDLPKLCLLFERLSIVRDISEKYHFLHWELEFADIFKEKGGFDLCIGNPPWVKLGFNEALVLADRHPVFAVKKLSAIQTMNRLLDTLQNAKTKALFESEYLTVTGMQNFFNAYQNYPLLKGQQTDLYKCFLPQTWKFGSTEGVSALIHPGSVFNDPKGGALRKEIYRRLLLRFGFKNEKLLFSDVANVKTFYLNIYRNKIDSTIDFKNIENLYDPTTIDECFNENIKGPVPQIKDKTGNWNLKGHPKRIIDIQEKELKLFAKLLDSSENFKEARLPILHSKELLPILDILANQPKTIESLGDNIFYTEMFHETKAQKSGIIKKNIHI